MAAQVGRASVDRSRKRRTCVLAGSMLPSGLTLALRPSAKMKRIRPARSRFADTVRDRSPRAVVLRDRLAARVDLEQRHVARQAQGAAPDVGQRQGGDAQSKCS